MAHKLRIQAGYTLPYTEQYTSFTVQASLELEFEDEEDLESTRDRINTFVVEELNRQIEQVNEVGPDIVGRRVTTRQIKKSKAADRRKPARRARKTTD